MIIRNAVQVKKYTSANDGYGGLTKILSSTSTVPAVVSIRNNDLKPLSSGLGYYRVIVLITNSDSNIIVGDEVIHEGVSYAIQSGNSLRNERLSCFVGYEL